MPPTKKKPDPERDKVIAHDAYVIAHMDVDGIDRDTDVLPDALCGNVENALFFPVDSVEKGGSGHFLSVRNPAWAKAMTICEVCRVRLLCLGDTIANRSLTRTGVWGGRTPDERDEIRRQSRATMLS